MKHFSPPLFPSTSPVPAFHFVQFWGLSFTVSSFWFSPQNPNKQHYIQANSTGVCLQLEFSDCTIKVLGKQSKWRNDVITSSILSFPFPFSSFESLWAIICIDFYKKKKIPVAQTEAQKHWGSLKDTTVTESSFEDNTLYPQSESMEDSFQIQINLFLRNSQRSPSAISWY